MSGLDAKDEILGIIKAGKPASTPLPQVPMYAFEGDPVESFIAKLVGFDGRAVKFATREDAVAWLEAQPQMNRSENIVYSTADGVKGNLNEEDLAELRNAHKIQTCVTEGLLGVGEMGAVWVTDESLGHAVCALLAKHLFVFLDKGRIRGGLHEAYSILELGKQQYGSFFTGPSATADIEAVRITGAQGQLSLTALVYNCEDAETPPRLIVNPSADASVWLKVEEEPD